MDQRALIIIPARMASTRFPNKPLAVIRGMTMIERVWRIACAVPSAERVVIATDDEHLQQVVQKFGAEVIMTSSACKTGTDRVAEASLHFAHPIVFSFQGDAVLTPPWVIEEVLQIMLQNPTIEMATPAVQLTGKSLEEFVAIKQRGDATGTTVTFNKEGNALYFSKALLPYQRDFSSKNRIVYRHIGLYAYRKKTLQRFAALPEGIFEASEQLEQLRALEHGIPIRVVVVDYQGRSHGSVDAPKDVAGVEKVIDEEGELIRAC